MSLTKICLNGDYEMEYTENGVYKSTEVPEISGCLVRCAVPSYWEDRIRDFSETFLYERLHWNPDFTVQKYPLAGYLPDMTLPTVVGNFLYRRNFTVSELDVFKEAYLSVGGAHNTLSAWINGIYIGTHEGFSSPFMLKIPDSTLKLGENEIIFSVSNLRLHGYKDRPISGCTTRAANNFTGGIYGDAEIILYKGEVRDTWVTVSDDAKSFTVNILRSSSMSAVEVGIFDGACELMHGVIEASEDSVKFDTGSLELWSPENPKRYVAKIASCFETHEIKFGIRSFEAEGTRLKLNGKYIMARGICEHGYYPETVHPPRDKAYYRHVIKTLKSLGFNFIRFHTWVPMAEYMEAADELGILMEVESPNNTSLGEWDEIIRYTRRYTAPVLYSTGNEMTIDEDHIEHLRSVSWLVHTMSDSLFSPMSAMRGIEYHSWGDNKVDTPFPHNPTRLATVSEFSDVFNSYPNGQLSYFHASSNHENIDKDNSIYKKPLLSHEICINGTYCDLSLEERYRGTRIGETALYSSVREHLKEKGLLCRAPLYHKNSSEWQRRLRKQCFEMLRRCETVAGYDFLGDIDQHWHTFGYCVGMMNEFYELKPSETRENVLRYNSPAVLLCDLPYNVNFEGGRSVTLPIHISNYKYNLENAELILTLKSKDKIYERRKIKLSDIEDGKITHLCDFKFTAPKTARPTALKLSAKLFGDSFDAENEWELYTFPKADTRKPARALLSNARLDIVTDIDELALMKKLRSGRNVLLLGTGPFAALGMSFQISLAGRTAGHLATVIGDNALMEEFPHEGFCGWQFRAMLDGAKTAVLDIADVPFEPLVEAVSTYKYAHKEALIFEYSVKGGGKLLVCTLRLDDGDPAARWLKSRIMSYAVSEDFSPKHEIELNDLIKLFNTNPIYVAENTNMARNTNDLTM